MPPPSRAHTTAAGSYQVRQNRNARARHSLDNTGFSIDSSELPSGLIVDYSIDDVIRPGNIAELGRGQQTENIHLDDDEEDNGDADVEPEEVDLGKANFSPLHSYCACRLCTEEGQLLPTLLPAYCQSMAYKTYGAFYDCELNHRERLFFI